MAQKDPAGPAHAPANLVSRTPSRRSRPDTNPAPPPVPVHAERGTCTTPTSIEG